MLALLLLLTPIAAVAKSIDIAVGQHGFKFTPDTIEANPGDKIHFHVYPGHHGMAQGTFEKPCKPKEDGFWSGYIDSLLGPSKKMWTLTINNTDATWIYCPTPDLHCQLGMSMVINPTKEQTLSDYQTRGKKTLSGQPKTEQGGVMTTKKGKGLRRSASARRSSQ